MKNKRTDFGKMEDELADVSLYGEFVSTFHSWVSSERQKNKVKELEDISEEK